MRSISKTTLSLVIGTVFITGMIYVRKELYTGLTSWVFLLWNIFLAWIPYIAAVLMVKSKRAPVVLTFLFIMWLLFFPNAPYLMTDLIHLKARPPVPMWYDALMLFMAAFLGLMLGILSLQIIMQQLFYRMHIIVRGIFILMVSSLTAIGVYLGRFERFNSWDVADPIRFLRDIKHTDLTYEMALFLVLFTGAFFACYLITTSIISRNTPRS